MTRSTLQLYAPLRLKTSPLPKHQQESQWRYIVRMIYHLGSNVFTPASKKNGPFW